MKKIDTTPIAAGVAYPPSKKGFDFLQSSYQQILAAIAQGNGGQRLSSTAAFALYGCVETDLGAGNFSYTAGFIYDALTEEVYSFPAVASIAIATAPVLTITITPDATADPTTFTDGSSQNVHDVRTLVLSDGALGSADIDYDDVIFNNGKWIANDAFTSYRRTGGCVYLNGLAGAGAGTAMTNTTTSLTLPVGFRPSVAVTLATVPYYDTVGATFPINGSGTLTIATDGKVTHSSLTGAGVARFISLQGISFNL